MVQIMAAGYMLFLFEKYWYFTNFSTKTFTGTVGNLTEASQRGSLNDYPQHMFCGEIRILIWTSSLIGSCGSYVLNI